VISGCSLIERWQNKLRYIRRFLKGWARNHSGLYRKEKERLLATIDELDIKAESVPLSVNERAALKRANDDISSLRREEEKKGSKSKSETCPGGRQ
jgi:hypothetical protein